MGKKKYVLRCFWCGNIFNSRDEVIRMNGMPVCAECLSAPNGSDDYEDDWIDDPEWDAPEW